ncbi:hypothetical protein [Nakamurella panacisegetis]|uniref:hypothetical protein n=1 Tax=Nakamurella panacisegetis TaxID=1090615 RepID=UPI00155FC544|nr:hypothetical protein [Nakamurella panacisegetis]
MTGRTVPGSGRGLLTLLMVVALTLAAAVSAPASSAATTTVSPIGGAAPFGATSLRYGHHLAAGGQLASPNRFVTMRMQTNGQLTVWAGGRQYWTSGTSGQGNYAQVERNGYLQIHNRVGRVLWSSHTAGTGNVLYVLNSGNVVIQTSARRVAWQTSTRASELDAAQTLSSGQALFGPGGEQLIMGSDGNLVLHRGSPIVWSTGTAGHRGARLVLTKTGNLVLYSTTNRVLWTSGTGNIGARARLVLRSDGHLVFQSAAGVVRWDPFAKPAPLTAADYASRLLAMWGGKVTGLPGAKSDLLATSRGQTIRNSDSCGNTVRVDIRVVRFLYTATSKYKIKINNIITGHGCDSAQHPKGRSTDLGGAWNLTTGAFTSFGGYWGANNYAVDREFAVYASSILPNGSGLGQSTCRGTSSARLRAGVQFFADACNHQHVQVQPSR